MATFDQHSAAAALRDSAGTIRLDSAPGDDLETRADVLDAIADYIDGTADGYSAQVYAEVAHAFLAGYRESYGFRVRIGAELRAALGNL